jgi:hypothetical protein
MTEQTINANRIQGSVKILLQAAIVIWRRGEGSELALEPATAV